MYSYGDLLLIISIFDHPFKRVMTLMSLWLCEASGNGFKF